MIAPVLSAVLCGAFTSEGPAAGLPGPEIQAKEWFNFKSTSLAKQRGNVVVLEFWATW